MSAKHWFSGSYQEARKRFLDSIEELRKRGFEVSQEELPLNLKGPNDEDLIIDLAVLGSLESENLLLYSSGIHGVEGFAGSAIQLSVLDKLKNQSPFSGYCIVFIHIINPYGMAWHRRVNENNVDFSEMVSRSKPDDLLTLIYTSGTTGTPKGVMLTHGNLCANITSTVKGIEFTDDDTLLSFLPLSHVFERMGGHFSSFSKGCTIYYAEGIEKVADNMGEVKPTLMLSVPRLYEKMYTGVMEKVKAGSPLKQKIFFWSLNVGQKVVEHSLINKPVPFLLGLKHKIATKLAFSKIHDRVGGKLRFFISGGAPLAQEIAEFFSSAGIQIMEGYGLTETSPVLTTNLPDQFRFGTVGKPIDGVSINIADDGEILAKGPNIMRGYYNDEESTKEVLTDDGWFSTGDIGEIDQDGFLKITDRKKNLFVTSGGKNVAPAPLENSLATSSYIDQVVVLGDKRNFISALIVPNFDNIKTYLSSMEKSVSGNEAMIEHQDVLDLIDKEVSDAMSEFSNYEKVKVFKLLSEPFTIEKGELTPKMSIVRKIVISNNHDLIESIYNQSKK